MTAIRIVAGPPLSDSASHCASVGAGWAIAETDRVNAAHWRAAEAGQRGYRFPDAPGRPVDQHGEVLNQSGSKPAPRAVPLIPEDLNCIPPFLRREPPQAADDLPLAA